MSSEDGTQGGTSGSEEEEDEEEAWREYPIWLQAAVKDDSEEKCVRIVDPDSCGGGIAEGLRSATCR